jgi:uncharacterized protein (TIGR02996 family)
MVWFRSNCSGGMCPSSFCPTRSNSLERESPVTHDDAFLQAILESPDDDTPRLVYADYLDEHGDPDRAEFIRVQVALAALPPDDPRRGQLGDRERRLLAGHREDWLGPLRPLLSGWFFRRGFLDAITVPAATYLRHATLPRPATVRRILIDLDRFTVPADALAVVPQSIAYRNVLLPAGLRGEILVLAVQDPLEGHIEETMRYLSHRVVEVVAAPNRQVAQALSRHYGRDRVFKGGEPEFLGCLSLTPTSPPGDVDLGRWDNGSPAARLLARLVAGAVDLNAREVRFRPGPDRIHVRFAGEGGTAEGEAAPVDLLGPVVSRLRVMAGIRFDPWRFVQAGIVRLTVRGRSIVVGIVIHRSGDGRPSVKLTF